MTPKRTIHTLALALFTAATSHAATITFDNAADFDNNFWSAASTRTTTWRGSETAGRIQRDGETSGADVFIYNTTSTGATTSGTGGTSASSSQNTFQDFIIQVDHRASTTGSAATSLGFWVKGNATGSAGYLVVFRLSSTTGGTGDADMRIWGPNSTSAGATGTALLTSTSIVPTSTLASSTDYTFRLQVQDVAGGVNFIGSMWDVATGNQLGSDITYTHTGVNAITGAGQVGIRIGSGGGSSVSAVDNFSIEAIPEPSAAALGLIAVAGAVLRRRR
jgi:hypothetical protein